MLEPRHDHGLLNYFLFMGDRRRVGVALARHPINGAIALVSVMLALAGIYGLLSGPFLGIVQIAVYAGAIMMLVVFVIMVVGGAMDHQRPSAGAVGFAGGTAALVFAGLMARFIAGSSLEPATTAPLAPSIRSVPLYLTFLKPAVAGTCCLN